MKRVVLALIALACLVSLLCAATAESQTTHDCFTIDGYQYYYNSDADCLILTGADLQTVGTDLVIPDQVSCGGTLYDVGYIDSMAFDNEWTITSVTIGDNVKGIGQCAFRNCESLKSVTFGNGLTTIGKDAFYDCYRLTSIVLPTSVATVGETAFWCCGLTGLTLNDGLETIGPRAFKGCSLKSLVLPNSVTEVGTGAFAQNPLSSIVFSSSLKTIESETFMDANLTAIEIPGTVKNIETRAFSGNKNLETVILREGVETIGTSAFSGSQVWHVRLPSTLKSMPTASPFAYKEFYDYSEDKWTVYKPTYEVYQGSWAHQFCESNGLEFITLQDFYFDLMPDGWILTGYGGLDRNVTVPDSWSEEHTVNLPVVGIGDSAFYGQDIITSVTLPATVQTIGASAFENCAALSSINLPSGMTRIGNNTFKNCATLTSVDLPAGLTAIGNSAFENCAGLSEIRLPGSLTDLGEASYKNCCDIDLLYLPASLQNLNPTAFEGDHVRNFYIEEALLNRLVGQEDNPYRACVIKLFGSDGNCPDRFVVVKADGRHLTVVDPCVVPTVVPTPSPTPEPQASPVPVTNVAFSGSGSTRVITVERGTCVHVTTDGLTLYTDDSTPTGSQTFIKPQGYTYNGRSYPDIYISLGNSLYFYTQDMYGSLHFTFTVMDYTADNLVGATGYSPKRNTERRHYLLITIVDPAVTPTLSPTPTPLPIPGGLPAPDFLLENDYPGLNFKSNRQVTVGSRYYVQYTLAGQNGAVSGGDSHGKTTVDNLFSLDFGDLGDGDFVLDYSLFQPVYDDVLIWQFDEQGVPVRTEAGMMSKGDPLGSGRLQIHAGALDGLVFPSALTSIADEAFQNLPVRSVDLPKGLSVIGSRAFADCSQLLAVSMPGNVWFQQNSFENCDHLVIYAPAGGSTEALCSEYGIPFVAD